MRIITRDAVNKTGHLTSPLQSHRGERSRVRAQLYKLLNVFY